MNTAQINAEKDLVNQAKTRTDVAQKLAAAKEINSAMSNLRDGIQNKEDIKRSSAYINADPTKVTATIKHYRTQKISSMPHQT